MGKGHANDLTVGIDGFPARLRAAIDRSGGATRIAQASGIPLSTLHNYLSGRSEPKRQAIASLARCLALDPWWLLTGEEGQPAAGETPTSRAGEGMADIDLLAAIAAALTSLYDEMGQRPDGLTFGRKCGQIHNAIRAAAVDAEERRTMLRLALALQRQELLDTLPAGRS